MYHKQTHIHFVGIGGIGMSGIATILRLQGYVISGCDADIHQKSIPGLLEIGCTVTAGNNTPSCKNSSIDILVYSSAIKPTNPEILAAQARGIPTIARALMLAELMRTKFSIAIAGSHGKTTTTSLISHILLENNYDPTVIIGGHLHTISHSARIGKGDYLVAEADESDRSLVRLQATLALITNIDQEHFETYTDLDDIKQTFVQFLNNLPFYGKAFLCADDPIIQSLLPITHIKTVLYATQGPADWYATDIVLEPESSSFLLWHTSQEKSLTSITLAIPGIHNVQNAIGAIALTSDLGLSIDGIKRSLATFQGVDRRFTYRGSYRSVDVFDDYGHHPREIKHVLEVAKRRTRKNLVVLFQPHRFTRTHRLWDEFIALFKDSPIKELIITDIYPASETPIPGVSAQTFVQALAAVNPSCRIHYAPLEDNFNSIKATVDLLIEPEDLLLILGAGKINRLIAHLND